MKKIGKIILGIAFFILVIYIFEEPLLGFLESAFEYFEPGLEAFGDLVHSVYIVVFGIILLIIILFMSIFG